MTRSRLYVPCTTLLLAFVAPSCGSEASTDDLEVEGDTGTATVELTRAPVDAKCLALEVKGAARTVKKQYDLTPNQASVFRLEGLPTGNDTFKANAYPSACSLVGASSTPNWFSEPKTALVSVVDVANVALKMIQNGRASVGVDFDPANAPSSAPPAPPVAGITSSSGPYLVSTAPGVVTKAILTVGDSPNNKPDGTPYRMVGLPDGLGAFDNGDGTFTVLMNHELGATVGIARAHGGIGAFVSRWLVRKSDLAVLSGEDLMKNVMLWSSATASYAAGTAIAFGRFCSSDLPATAAFYDGPSGLGYDGRIYMNGEETGNEGRGVAHVLDGTSWELPRLGKFSWENALANANTGQKTVVAGTDDSTPGQVYFYVGTKTSSGSPVDKAGLTNGKLYGFKVEGLVTEPAAGIPSGTAFVGVDLGNVEAMTGAQLEAASGAAGVLTMNRPEDGAWDPNDANAFYFVTTASFTGPSRLWRLRFVDVTNPMLGGTIDMLLDGTEGHKMFDNMMVDRRGHVLATEDVGSNDHIGRVFRYDIATDALAAIAQHDPARFAPGAAGFLTRDEEASGIIDASDILGDGWFLVDSQAHYANGTELVEGGQLMAIYDPATLL